MNIRFLRNAAGDGDGGGGAPTEGAPAPEAKAFTPVDVERIVKDRVSKANAEVSKLQAQVAELAERAREADDLRHQLATANKSDVEKQLAEYQREAAKARQSYEVAAKEREAAIARAADAEKQRDAFIVETRISDALARKGCLPSAIKAATDLMVKSGNVEVVKGEDGSVKLVSRIGGFIFDDALTAAEAYLKENPYFQAQPGGGAGTGKPSGNGRGGVDLQAMPAEERIRMGLRQP